jgi:hypothetical protein
LIRQRSTRSPGLKGKLNERQGVYRLTFPRDDVKVAVDGWMMPPFMGLGTWAAFSQDSRTEAIVMGDTVLFEDEVNPAISAGLDKGLGVTALHNHFFFDHPKVYFMHIAKTLPEKGSISSKPLNEIFGMQGEVNNGMVKYTIGRPAKMHGMTVAKDMGVNTWAAFAGSDDNAIVDGDFAVTEDELQPVLKSLLKSNLNNVAIHQHMTREQPRIMFFHYWGRGAAKDLAQDVKGGFVVGGLLKVSSPVPD